MATLFSSMAAGTNPTFYYTLTASETGRSSSTVTYSLSLTAWLHHSAAYYSADIYPKMKIGGTTQSFPTMSNFSGTTKKTVSMSMSVSASAGTSSLSYTFSATGELAGSSGVVSGKTGTVSCSVYATTPSLSGAVTIKDGSTTVSSYYRENIGTGSFTLDWANQSGGNGTILYELERSTNGGTWTDVNNSISGSTTPHAPGASTTSIRYRVRAKNTVGTTTLYSGWIYSSTVNRNSLTSPSLTSSATIYYATKTFTLSLSGASDNLGSSKTYTISSNSANTVISGTTGVSPGTITINSNNGTSGTYITWDNMKKAALSGAAHSDTNDYKGTVDLKVTCTNAYGSSTTDTVSVVIDLGRDAPVSGTPSVSILSSSYFTISSASRCFPEFKPVTLSIPTRIQDALGRNCSFEIIQEEGQEDFLVKNIGIITITTATTVTVDHIEAALQAGKKTVTYMVGARTYNGVVKYSSSTPAIDLHYYKKPSVTSSALSRIAGSANFKVSITPNNSLTGATNTSTIPSGYSKGTSTITSGVESYTVNSTTTLADTYTAKISIVIRDSIGYILANSTSSNDVTLSVTIPKFQPALSIREKGIGIFGYATDAEALLVNGNITINAPGFGGLVISTNEVGKDATISMISPGGKWSVMNDDSDSNVLDFRWNNVRQFHIEQNGNLNLTKDIYLPSNGAIYARGNSGQYILRDHGNGNVTVSGNGGDLYLGYLNTNKIRLTTGLWSNNANREIINAAGTLLDISQIKLSYTNDASATSTNHAFTIGNDTTGDSMKIDTNEVSSFMNGGNGQLNLNPDGGVVAVFNTNGGGTFYNRGEMFIGENMVDTTGVNRMRLIATGGISYIQGGNDLNDSAAEMRITRMGTSSTNLQNLRLYTDALFSYGDLYFGNSRTILWNIPGNFDQTWFDDGSNTYHFTGDAAGSKSTGNAILRASSFTTTSDRKKKTKIKKFEDDLGTRAVDKVKNSAVYTYRYTHDENTEISGRKAVKKRIGIMADEAPEEILGVDGASIDLYAMTSYLWKSVQELSEHIEYLEKKLKRR